MKTINIAAQPLILLAQRAVFWPATQTLLVADTHFGKNLTFAKAGIPVPRHILEQDLAVLTHLIAEYAVARIIFLGDFLHHKSGCSEELLLHLTQWRLQYPAIAMIIIVGNHDQHAGLTQLNLPFQLYETLLDPPFYFIHEPCKQSPYFVICGHVHPVVTYRLHRKESYRLPCFWQTEDFLVLPAFSEFTGGYNIELANTHKLYAIVEDAVILV